MILVKKGRYSLRNTKENVETAANWGTSHPQCRSNMVKDDKYEVICNYCKKPGHYKANCFKLQRKNQESIGNHVGTKNGIAGSATDVVLNTMTANDKIDKRIWIGDSGASCTLSATVKKVYSTTANCF